MVADNMPAFTIDDARFELVGKQSLLEQLNDLYAIADQAEYPQFLVVDLRSWRDSVLHTEFDCNPEYKPNCHYSLETYDGTEGFAVYSKE